MPTNDLQALVGRTELLVTAISDAILSAAEAAAERVELAATVARVQQRLTAFTAVLEAVAVQKRALAERLDVADGPAKALIHRQIELLGLQEIAVLQNEFDGHLTVQDCVESPKNYAHSGTGWSARTGCAAGSGDGGHAAGCRGRCYPPAGRTAICSARGRDWPRRKRQLHALRRREGGAR